MNKKKIFITCVFLLVFSNIINAQNFYFSLFLSKELELKKILISDSYNILAQIDKFKEDIINNISADTQAVYKIISDFEIFKIAYINNPEDKPAALKHYNSFKNSMISILLKQSAANQYLQMFIDSCFTEFNKIDFSKDYILLKYKFEEFDKLIVYFKNLKEIKKLNEPRTQFMHEYFFHINSKLRAAFDDKDSKSFKTSLAEMQTIYDYIINRLNLQKN